MAGKLKEPAAYSGEWSSVPETHIIGGEGQLLQVVI